MAAEDERASVRLTTGQLALERMTVVTRGEDRDDEKGQMPIPSALRPSGRDSARGNGRRAPHWSRHFTQQNIAAGRISRRAPR